MAWEKRGQNLYYYRKQREGKRVRSIYVGRGKLAALFHQFETLTRHEKEAGRETVKREFAKLSDQDSIIEAASQLIDAITQASLLSAGFHLHKREWRKRRRQELQ